MALTTPEPRRFMLRDGLAAQQAHNAIDEEARGATPIHTQIGDETDEKLPSYEALVEEVRRLKKRNGENEHKIIGLRNLRSTFITDYWNPSCIEVETEVGFERLSNPKTNYVQNGGFRVWNAAVTLPVGWTATNSPTISRVSARTGAQGGNYAVRVASGGSAGSISRSFRVKGGAIYSVAGWVYLGDADTVATITLTDNGGTPVVKFLTLTAGSNGVGVAGWFHFPRVAYSLLIQTASDATSCTIKLESSANDTTDFSDFQVVQGPQVDADLWEDGAAQTGSDGYTPTGNVVLNADGVTPGPCYFTVNGDQAHVWGTVAIDATAAGACQVRLTTPIVTNFGAVTDASGGFVHGPVAGLCGEITAIIATDDLLFGFISPDGNQRTFQWWADFRII